MLHMLKYINVPLPLVYDHCHSILPACFHFALTPSVLCHAYICSTTYEDDQFFKFCVNNSANLLAVVSGRNCRDLTGKSDTRQMMEMILQEQFDVLQVRQSNNVT